MNDLAVYELTEEDLEDYMNIYTQTKNVFYNYLQNNYLSVENLKRRNVIDFMTEYVGIMNLKDIVLCLNVEFEICKQLRVYDEMRCLSLQETVALVCELLLIYLYEDETQYKEVI